jgi:chaperonin GroEL|tara:strand:- start:596 stop:2113 length:1518 start_codon:yes stop_codon:yes gene_type:complete
LADNVASTLGPRGRNVILQERGKRPIITKDGVSVAEFVDLEDPVMNAGVQIIKQAARETNNAAGDGTTTATVLARAILNSSRRYLTSGVSPTELKKGLEKGSAAICKNIEELARPIQSEEDIAHIATISANNDETIGNLIAKAVSSVGKDGSITIEEARSVETSLDLVEGFRFNSGYAASAFVTDERRGMVTYEDCLILVADCKIDKVEQILHVLKDVAREQRPLIIVASEIEGQALAALIMNTVRGTMKIVAVKAPYYGEQRRNIMKDLCATTGAAYVTNSGTLKLADVKLENLGSCKKVEILKNVTTIVDGAGQQEEVDNHIEAVKAEINNTEDMHECERLQQRITRLGSGVAIIKVGAMTEVEMVEKKHRLEDALEAVKAARDSGIVPGGGVALLRSIEKIELEVENEDQHIGVQCVIDAVREPFRQMAINAGESPDLLENALAAMEPGHGFNFRTMEPCHMIEQGIIDPAKVTITALQNAVSAAGTLITTGHAIIEGKNEG